MERLKDALEPDAAEPKKSGLMRIISGIAVRGNTENAVSWADIARERDMLERKHTDALHIWRSVIR